MSETRKTLTFGGVALVLLVLALVTAPRNVRPDAFLDQGEAFFPEFTDPNLATSLEVIEFSEETAEAKPFKVIFQDGKWTIPSHHDYPADGKDRLARTAAGVIGIRKEGLRSTNIADHEACGVIDPLDESVATLVGRGKRVTIRGEDGQILADLIMGKKVESREDLYFVRLPDQKRVYTSRVDLDLSTKFEDWIEKDLLQVEKDKIDYVVLRDYSINERIGTIEDRDLVELKKDEGTWKANRMSSSEEVDTGQMNSLLTAIDELSIVGVRPKPEGLSASLKRTDGGMAISQSDLLSLQSRGYFFARDGQLLSNEGELEVRTSNGIDYVLRFGEILYGTGEAVSAGSENNQDSESGPGENRYLFITASFDPDLLPEPPQPRNTDFQNKSEDQLTNADRENRTLQERHDQWQEEFNKSQELAEQLNQRFADWYYVISSDSFDKVRVKRSEIVQKKEKDES